MTKANQQGKATKRNEPTWLGKSIWQDKTSLLARKQFSVQMKMKNWNVKMTNWLQFDKLTWLC
jgi:hypothetical protein